MRALRWLLLLVAVGASGALAVVLSLCFVSAANAFCPANELVSGVCTSALGSCCILYRILHSYIYWRSARGIVCLLHLSSRTATRHVVFRRGRCRLCGLPLSGRAGVGVLPCHCRCSRRGFHSHQTCITRHASSKTPNQAMQRTATRCEERLNDEL